MATITITKDNGSTETLRAYNVKHNAETIRNWRIPGTFHDLKQRKYHTLTFITEEE
ncbi:hypothetical protein [Bifidobacterium moukalabense]|uniref:hypothetical protein n=1 Tax=Bifidobacterium moukalabense TaxID=1333651 RepID=UPI00148598C0|nr:hypothetical protein [Bifidobacterium moukalabense]